VDLSAAGRSGILRKRLPTTSRNAPMPENSLDLIATCAFGLEAVVRRELASLGIEATIGSAGRVQFRGSLETIARTNVHLRCADRVLIRVAEFPAADFDTLFETVRAVRWGETLPVEAAFPVTGRSVRSTLSSVPACQRSVKRAVVDALRRDHATEVLPESGATYRIEVALLKDTATVTIDTTGRSLHRRGYRTDISRAPLKETLAAAMVLLSFWKPDRPLLDPFCGSGTIAIEAARIGCNIAPGIDREFSFADWTNVPGEMLEDIRSDARAAAGESIEERILASDLDGRVLRAARDNAARAGVAACIHFQAGDARRVSSRRRFGCLITNPPYGHRVGEDRELEELYRSLPDVFRRLPTWSHYVLTAYPDFERLVGRSADRRRKLYNGRIECTYYQFHGPKPVVGTGGQVARGDERDDAATASLPAATASQPAAELSQPAAESAQPAAESAQPTAESAQPAAAAKPSAKPYVHAVGEAAFGQLDAKAHEQAELFAARLRKRARHLRRWPTRRGITCFRLYERDIPEIPLVVDRYEDQVHISEYERPHERTPAQHANWLDLMASTAAETLDVPESAVHFKRRGRQKNFGQHEKVDETGERLVVREGGLKFLVNLEDYVDTGLFLDHRIARAMVREEAAGKSFLNLFAYTGAFTVYAAAGGARRTTTVDLSNTYVAWARENLQLNGLLAEGDSEKHRLIAQDVMQFVERHPPGERYDLVVLDPPTYSRSKKTARDWNVQRDALPLLEKLLPLVRRGGVIFFSSNFRRFKFDPSSLAVRECHEISKQTVPEDFRNRRIHRCWRLVR
jgi:23S rRNA (guanine2445-N2)-methyltransferase / 23S rRNA (guanine2069-N7)-methyltransferase